MFKMIFLIIYFQYMEEGFIATTRRIYSYYRITTDAFYKAADTIPN